MNKGVLLATFLISLWLVSIGLIDAEGIPPDGKKLALKYCQSCHLFTEPALLDKKTWMNSVLPNMGMRLGIKNTATPLQERAQEEEKILKAWNIYPETPLLSKTEWKQIVDYFEQEAPSELPAPKTVLPLADQLPQFKAYAATLTDHQYPQTTLIKFDPATLHFFIGDAHNELFITNHRFQLINKAKINSPATDIDFPRNKAPRLLSIGSVAPSDQAQGQLLSLDGDPNALNIPQLARPIQFAAGDLNEDGKEDIVICSFGNNRGKLAWYESGDVTKEQVLSALPGSRRVEIKDFNGDQKNDLMVLRSQAYEAISIFYNRGKGQFEEKIVLQFPPVYGSSYFELADFNQDGFQDILLTNGDNWDYSAILKPYHGARVYLNDGRDNFKAAFFYPLYGCSKAMARDFDNDGDIDIAAISFYADLENPAQGFIYLSNEGNLHFKAFSTPEAALGKWLTMEAGDFDKDGDVDIVLGSYFHTVGEVTKLIVQGVSTFPQLLVLYNQQSVK